MNRRILFNAAVASIFLLILGAGQSATAQENLIFRTAGSYAVPGRPVSLVIGDFDGNHLSDLAVASYSDDAASVSILLGRRNGSFFEALNFDGGNGAQTLAVGDFNGDGHTDLAASAIRFDLMIYLGNGDGTLQMPRVMRSVIDAAQEIIVRDFDGDGTDDLAVAFNAGYGLEEAWLGVFRGNGDGTFQNAIYMRLGSRLRSITIGDFDLDSKFDLAWSSWISNDVISLRGNGDGTFQSGVITWIGGSGRALVSGDFNNDGMSDVAAVTGDGASYVAPLLNQGGGTFWFAPNSQTGVSPSVAVTADFNRDGNADLVMDTRRNFSDTVSFMLGNGTGSFSQVGPINAGGSPWRLAVGALDANKLPDLAVANFNQQTVTILLNRTKIINHLPGNN